MGGWRQRCKSCDRFRSVKPELLPYLSDTGSAKVGQHRVLFQIFPPYIINDELQLSSLSIEFFASTLLQKCFVLPMR